MTEASSTGSSTLNHRIDDACDSFEKAWRAGHALSLRDAMDNLSASDEERPVFFRELLLLELELKAAAGEPNDPILYIEEFPDDLRIIAEAFRKQRAVPTQPGRSPYGQTDFETMLRYRLIEPIAEGGLGRIYRVYETTLGRELAMKEIKQGVDNANTRARFDREARLTGRLDHPGITPVFGIGSHPDGRPLYVMRLIRGESLRDVIRRHHTNERKIAPGSSTLVLKTLLGKFVSVCDVIAYAHSQNVVHRDLKPSNIMLGPYGEVIVVDWGLAKEVASASVANDETVTTRDGTATRTSTIPTDSFQTVPGRAVGTPQFMSPEQALARVDEIGPASDIYSLGATLYDLLTGRPPFADSNESDAVLRRVVIGDFLGPRKFQPSLPRALEAICLKAMALQPKDRYSNAEALADDLRRWLADEPVGARPEPFWERGRRWLARRRVAVAGFAGALLIALGVGIPWAVSNRLAKEAEQSRVQALAASILASSDESFPGLLAGLKNDRGDVLQELRNRFRDEGLDDDARLKGALALGPTDLPIRDYLEKSLFEAPLVMLPWICDALHANHSGNLIDRLQSTLKNEKETDIRRFHAAVSLARFTELGYFDRPGFWTENADRIVAGLIDSIADEPSHFDNLVKRLRPVRHELFPALADEFRDIPRTGFDGRRSALRTIAAAILDRYADTPRELAELLEDTFEGPRLIVYLDKLRAAGDLGIKALTERLDRTIPLSSHPNISDPPDPDLAADLDDERRGRLASGLFQIGARDRIWPLFGSKGRPGVRTSLIRILPQRSAEIRRAILERLPIEPDPAIRQGLIESLASFPSESLNKELTLEMRRWLLNRYESDPDSGVHSIIDWFFRTILDDAAAIRGIDAKVKANEPAPGFHWYTDLSGQTLAIVKPVDPLPVGSPADEPGRSPTETIRRVRVGRTFAIADREVSLELYRQYTASEPKTTHPLPALEVPKALQNSAAPVVLVSWQDVGGFCNWLSRINGIAESEWCYGGVGPDRIKLVPNALEKTGFRLPTDAEWEIACRAGSATSRPFGDGWESADQFGWFPENADGRLRAVGLKRPNILGLFDMLGNAAEWTLTPYRLVASTLEVPGVVDDRWDELTTPSEEGRVIRGGSILMPLRPRSALHDSSLPTNRVTDLGLRVCRTLPAGH